MDPQPDSLAADTPLLVYITAPNRDTAVNLGRMLIARRLAACVNVVPKMVSIYRWQDEVQTENESLLLVKTLRGRWAELEQAVKAAHPYEVPCITAVSLDRAHEPFAAWIRGEATGG